MSAPGRNSPAKGLAVAILTALIGPFAGCLVLWTAAIIRVVPGLDDIGSVLGDVGAQAGPLMFITVFAYILALLPAGLCGAYLGWYTVRHGAVSRMRAVMASVAATIAGLSIEDGVMKFHGNEGSLLPLLVLLIPLAGGAALLCRWLFSVLGLNPGRPAG